jgi:hypothetical protein
MSDQCKYCSLRGDIDKCLAQDCKQDYWIVDYLLKELSATKKAKQENDERFMLERDSARGIIADALKRLEELPKECWSKTNFDVLDILTKKE